MFFEMFFFFVLQVRYSINWYLIKCMGNTSAKDYCAKPTSFWLFSKKKKKQNIKSIMKNHSWTIGVPHLLEWNGKTLKQYRFLCDLSDVSGISWFAIIPFSFAHFMTIWIKLITLFNVALGFDIFFKTMIRI